MELSIEELNKRFGTKSAVSNISVTLQPGVYGLLGAIVNLHHEAGNEVSLRIVSDTQPISGAVNVVPTLDDIYLYHFEDEEVRRDER